MQICTLPYCTLTDERMLKLRGVLAKLTIGQILGICRCIPNKKISHASDRPAVEFQQVHQQAMDFMERAIDWYTNPFGKNGAVRQRVDGCRCVTLIVDGKKFPSACVLVDGLNQITAVSSLLLDWALKDCGYESESAPVKKKLHPILRVKPGKGKVVVQ